MVIFKKSDMVYDDYKWTAYPDDNPHVTGPPDSTLFNRHEGYEVLYLINSIAKEKDLTVTTCKNIEKSIREKLPGSTRSQQEVRAWIVGLYKL